MAKAASGCIHDKSGNEDLTETAPFTAKIGSKRAYLPDSELPSKRTMLDTAKERPGAITRLLCEFSARRDDTQTLDNVSRNPGALTAFLGGCVARWPPESPFVQDTSGKGTWRPYHGVSHASSLSTTGKSHPCRKMQQNRSRLEADR